jgi:hypothetical protein
MASSSRYTVRGLLVFVAIVAACFAVLATPSAWWALLLPVAVVGIVAVAIRQIFETPRRRPFWATLASTLVAYMAAVTFVYEYGGRYIWRQIGMELWTLFHQTPQAGPGGIAYLQAIDGSHVNGFYACVHFIFACVLALVASLLVQSSYEKAQRDKRDSGAGPGRANG